jgi:hypothetical protein
MCVSSPQPSAPVNTTQRLAPTATEIVQAGQAGSYSEFADPNKLAEAQKQDAAVFNSQTGRSARRLLGPGSPLRPLAIPGVQPTTEDVAAKLGVAIPSGESVTGPGGQAKYVTGTIRQKGPRLITPASGGTEASRYRKRLTIPSEGGDEAYGLQIPL